MPKKIHSDPQIVAALGLTPVWLREEATEIAASTDAAGVIDGLLDTLGICIITLGAYDRSQLLKAASDYCASQASRGRDPNSMHTQTVRTVVALVVACAPLDARIANVKKVFAGKIQKGFKP